MSVAVFLPLATSHNWTVLSVLSALLMLPEARVLPSGLKATEVTSPACDKSVAVYLPLATSQSLTAKSLPPEAKVLPSGLNATDTTDSVCPPSVSRNLSSPADSGEVAISPTQANQSTRRMSHLPFVAPLVSERSRLGNRADLTSSRESWTGDKALQTCPPPSTTVWGSPTRRSCVPASPAVLFSTE